MVDMSVIELKKNVDIKCNFTSWFQIQTKEKRSCPTIGATFDMSGEKTIVKFLYETGYKMSKLKFG